ncbi:MAG: Rrf2 family transcriptional regulator [Candidatus Shapirobacteria bacterium]|jgi:Rrf2 family protein
MIKVPKKIEYSLMLMAYLSESKDENTSLRQVAERLALPYRYLARIAADLKKGGVLISKEGKLGGYVMDGGWRQKNFFELLTILGENKRMVKCFDGDCGRAEGCRWQKLWRRLEKGLSGELKKINLGDIC